MILIAKQEVESVFVEQTTFIRTKRLVKKMRLDLPKKSSSIYSMRRTLYTYPKSGPTSKQQLQI